MFTDVEMAILSQLAYCEYDQIPPDLHTFLKNNQPYLEEELGGQYTNALNLLIEKTAMQDYKIVASKDDSHTGFAAFAVEGPNNEVAVACRGTEFSKILSWEAGSALTDVYADLMLTLDQESAQQKKMEEFLEDLEKKGYNGYYFTGHSLGGNISLHGAMTLNDPALVKGVVTYNAPGFNEEYWEKHRYDYTRIQDRAYIYQNERDAISEALISPPNAVILDCGKSNASGMKAHGLAELVIDESGGSFQNSMTQQKQITGWGLAFGGGSKVLDASRNDNKGTWNILPNWNGTTINVPLGALQENARIMQELTDVNADVFDRVYNSLLCLKGGNQWQGTSLEAIVTATENNRKKFADTIAEMRSLAAFLDKFVVDMQQKDIQIKNQIDAV